MNNELILLYNQVKEQKISYKDAVEQFKLLESQLTRGISPPPSLRNEYNISPEIYAYDEPYLRDHTVYSEQVLIGVTHGSLAINAFFKIFPQEDGVHLHRLNFVKPIEVKPEQRVEVLVEPVQKGDALDFQVLYRYASSGAWSPTATGSLRKALFESEKIDLEKVKDSLEEFQHLDSIYTGNSAVGLGDSFKTITRQYTGKDRVLARIVLQETSLTENHAYVLNPLITNSAFLAVGALLGGVKSEYGFLPFGIKDIYLKKIGRLEQCWLLVRLVKNSGEMVIFDADVIDDESQVVARFSGCSVKRLRSGGQISAAEYAPPDAAVTQQYGRDNSDLYRLEVSESTSDLSNKIQRYLTNKLGKIVPDRSRLANREVNLMDLGVDSSQLVALASEIEKEANIELYPTLFFEYPNIKELTGFFFEEHQESFAGLLGIDAKQPAASGAARRTGEVILPEAASDIAHEARAAAQTPGPAAVNTATAHARDDIAVIGMHGLFAEATDLKQFWHNLRDKKDLMKEVPVDHWDYRPWYDENPEGKDKTYCKWGSFIDNVDKFDAGFFNISPREAEWMDPQLRLLLQSIYAAGEDAGYINQLRGTNTGVFVGVCFHDYADKIAELNLPMDPYAGTGNSQTVIANRVSYLFNFTGPSMAVDTACSSSLFALHYACHALRNKECDLAFVGGVNLLLSSRHYRYFCSIGALSPTGRCHTFDEAADGYVPGECVASVLLKPLRQAERDGDRIYAVIKGSAALHGGYTPSLTAPSVAGEENVMLKAWADAGIDPETLTYIEAHGTGTKLGDPVEINSLKKAFRRFTSKEHFCAVGSAKANIGHTEGAAGIAGILKVILQMKHRQIPALPRFNKLNPYIQLDESALYINGELEEWKSPAGVPRRAGVSSFGFSGAYAHVVIEEYLPKEPKRPLIAVSAGNPAIIVLSARNEDRLRARAGQLLAAIQDQQFSDANLADMAYTLQVGREAMEERLALTAGSVKELEEKLKSFVEGQYDVEDLYRGQVRRNNETLAVFTADEELQEAIEKWIRRKKYSKLLDFWVKGLIFDWNKLHDDAKPSRTGLPTYPFDGERYWISDIGVNSMTITSPCFASVIHPLLHQNTSDLSEQRFSSTFTGQEFFLADHVVKGQRVLPGAAYLEMARTAAEQAAGALAGDHIIRLKNVVWVQPVIVGEEPLKVDIGLFPEDNGAIAYEIYNEQETGDTKPVVHSQGSIELSTITLIIPPLDIMEIQSKCRQSLLTAGQCYEAFRTIGLDYGPGHQGIEKVYVGQGQVLAKLMLPEIVADTLDQFVLHPSLLDSALQASIVLITGSGDMTPNYSPAPFKPALPFALDEIVIVGKCTSSMWALIRYHDGTPEDKVQKLDLVLCDEQGTVCLQMRGFSTRILDGEILPGAAKNAVSADIFSELLVGAIIPEQQPVKIQTEEVTEDLLRRKSTAYIKKLVGAVLKIPDSQVDSAAYLGKYGLDSILVVQLTNILRKTFDNISSTLFFEYQTIDALTEHFIKTKKDALSALVGLTEQEPGGEIAGEILPQALPAHYKQAGRRAGRFLKFRDRELAGFPAQAVPVRDVAIIGLAGRYPGAKDVNEYWRNLKEGRNCISEIPQERWDWREYFDKTKGKEGAVYTKWGGFIKDIDKFDPLFFQISPKEAEKMDPQERLFLEVAYASIEDAGYTPAMLADNKKVGVFVGVMNGNYPTGPGYWSIANRISYLFNLQGPSMAVDTACSSSLTAIHLALESLYSGISECAIAGGVNLIVDPVRYLILSSMNMLSAGDQCKSFGDQADGFIDSEGVGVIVLKPLPKAIADGDHIYGIIKGSMLNAGGKTNGYTVPNPQAQSEVIAEALRRAKIDARTVSYVEAHGTGTALGDPIEIAGLTKAFQEYTKDKQFCAIGSVKSNIGHSESAAGIAGVTKVLLQLKHQQLVPSLHSKVLNTNIDFGQTPFAVQQELAEWKRPVVDISGETREYPRIAGVSSFGAGGANVHVVIEEYIPTESTRPQIAINQQNQAVIVLSAKNEERLLERVQQLLAVIGEQQLSDSDLTNMAYTLQVGREAMEERLAVAVGSMAELVEKLKGFAAGQEGIKDLYRGKVKRNEETLAVFSADEEMQEAIDKWIQRGKYAKLLDLWVKGLHFDWRKLYSNIKHRRISLPTYPFAKERYWVPEIDAKTAGSTAAASVPAATIHPLLHQNTSDFSEQRFSSTFTGREFFLADHVVKGQRVLPGVAYLEMARAAVEQAAGILAGDKTGVRLKNVVWARPIAVGDQPVTVHVGLFLEDNGEITYEIYSKPAENSTKPTVHSQGRAVLTAVTEVPPLDLGTLQAQCSHGILTPTQCYEIFSTMGINYGPGHRGIEAVYTGKGQVLAKLALPPSVRDKQDWFILHPSLLDAALQAAIGLKKDSDASLPPGSKASLKPALPFALQELEILGNCTSAMWALIRYSDGSKAGDMVQELNIDLCDDHGRVCIRMKGFSARVLEGEIQVDTALPAIPSGTFIEPFVGSITLTPVWDSILLEKGQAYPSETDQVVIVGGNEQNINALRQYYPQACALAVQSGDSIEAIMQKLQEHGSIDHILWLAPEHAIISLTEEALIEEQNRGVLQCFRMVKALLNLGYANRDLGWSVITVQSQAVNKQDAVNPAHASLHGLIGSLAKEYPNWKIRLVDLAANCDWPLAAIFTLPTDPGGNSLAYRGQEWYRQKLVPLYGSQRDQTLYKTGGVYVVIGGAGGIGEVLSEYLIRTYQARIIWIGRRQKDAVIQAKLDRLAVLGPAPSYIAANATDRDALHSAYAEIKERYSQINGIIHSAIVLFDQSLANMDEERFQAGLSAKVDVSVRIAQVFNQEPLDFVLFFSSFNSFTKAPGQSNYVSGCIFKDIFAHQLAHEWSCAVKVINWGYWGSVGIVASQTYQDRMAQVGIGSIEAPEAMDTLETLLAGTVDQIALLKTTKPLAMDIINSQEQIVVYPEGIHSYIRDVKKRIYEQTPQLQLLKSQKTIAQHQEMGVLLCRLLLGQLQSSGLFTEKNPVAGLKTKGPRDFYDRWLQESISVLTRNHYLTREQETYTVTDPTPIDIEAVWKEWDAKKRLWLEDSNIKAQVNLVEATLRALPDILTGKTRATDIMFPNSSMELVEGVYKNNPVADYFNETLAGILVSYIEERLSQDPAAQIRIIEIGAGTGGTSAMIFKKLTPYRDHIKEYCYTDISQAFLIHAREKYGPDNPYLICRIFNVEASLAEQNIPVCGYDIAIAANVLHATRNIRYTLRNTKAVLKKNGLLILNEISVNSLFTHLTFGLLEGWWLYEDPWLRIPGCPGLSPQTWQSELENIGFRSIFFPEREALELGQQIIIAESDGVVRQKCFQPGTSFIKKDSETRECRLEGEYKPLPIKETVLRGAAVTGQMVKDHVRMIIKESISEALKMEERLIQDDRSFSEYGVDSIIAVNLVNLINRQCHIVLPTTVLFDYSNVNQLTNHIVQNYYDILIASLQNNMSVLGTSSNFGEAINIPTRKKEYHAAGSSPGRQKNRFLVQDVKTYENPASMGNYPTYHRVVVERPGAIKDLRIFESGVPDLKENEVRIAVRAFSLNFGDLLCVKGLYPTMPPYPFTPGFEASGIVVEIGSAVTAVQKGDSVISVMGNTLGGQASLVTCPEEQVFKKPETLSFEEACSLPIVALTMIDAFQKARLKKGEKILIQTAAGGTGLIAVQLAQYYGAEIYATAGSEQKLDYLKNLDVPYLINYQETDFEMEIKRLTHGKGVDVVINTLAGDAMQKGLNCLAPRGRYIEIAMTALKSAKAIDLSVLSNNQTFYSVDLRKLALEEPETSKDYISEMLQLIERRIIRPTICRIFPFNQLGEAYQYMENRNNIGKIVVSIPAEYQFRNITLVESAHSNFKAPFQKEPIAIIGMSGRFAGSKNANELWEHLSKGDDLVAEVSRWDLSKYYPEGTSYCKQGSFLEDIDRFDPLFFNISGLEATYMDPQQRLFLEESWKALEDAGYAGSGVKECLCGVYVGCAGGDYPRLFVGNPPAQAFWGNADSVIPARIAYHLDLRGPAIAVDTACSSSLVAIHLGCQGLWAGETELAIAGGVFLQATPGFYLSCNRAGMLSPTGHCNTFDERADGFVPGEGVGAVVLKRLKEAVADGDHIYGVIRGSGINQDGATNGITAPSANSQERLERYVYDTFNIHPGQIQMVEAHGTGTKLGDPIEYQALTRSFRFYTDKQEYCAIGSIKTNLGHAAYAAGIAGFIKILLSLQHKQIPPSLHFQAGNSNIQFKGSPFYVNTNLKNWDVEQDSTRCAVISSFGFSGTNAHMVIEEAPKIERWHSEKPGYLIVLSARTFEQLKQQAEQLIAYCEREPQADCGNMSYTLLLGRKHFNCRLACVAYSQQELITLLKKWLEKGKIPQVYVAQLHESDQREQPSLKHYGNQCIRNCHNVNNVVEYLEHLATIADLYIQGYDLDFAQLFAGEQCSRIILPTYPFARERYWVPKIENKSGGSSTPTTSVMAAAIHPLLQQNTSDLSEQRFSSTFTGEEFFLADHIVNGQRILPGVAYLEMARAAVEQAVGTLKDGQNGIRLKNVVWVQPLTVQDQPVRVHIGLFPEDNGEVNYEIYSQAEDTKTEPVVHSQGRAVLSAAGEVPVLDLPALQAQCSLGSISSSQCYEAFRMVGLAYGSGYQGIEKVYVGQDQVLAELSLPSSISETKDQFILHPSLMDAALQASIGLILSTGDWQPSGSIASLKPVLPFALQEFEILEKCTPSMWALVRHSDGSQAGDKIQKLDIDLCDEQGRVCVRMKGFSSRVLDGEVSSAGTAATIGMLLLAPSWQEQAVIQDGTVPDYVQHLVILCEQGGISRETIENNMTGVRCFCLESDHNGIAERFQTCAIQAFAEIQNILKARPMGKVLIQIVVGSQEEHRLLSGVTGLLKTAQLENPKLIGQLIEVDTREEAAKITGILQENSRIPLAGRVRYQNGKRYIAVWNEIEENGQEAVKIPWQDRGVYLITGGVGGLGLIFAKEIADRVKEATLILVGRSPLNADKQTKLKGLEASGARVMYIQADVTREEAVAELIQRIQEDFGSLHGIIHGAGVIRDNFILKKTREEIEEVLAPKVRGLVNLDQASKDLPLNFFIFFSSGAGAMGNIGQADYAAANAFMDAYARYRNTLVTVKQRHGRTLSINWPLWQEGGMRVDPETEKMMWQNAGLIAMKTATGISALYRSLTFGQEQVLVMEGNLARMKQKIYSQASSSVLQTEKAETPIKIDTGSLLDKVQAILTQNVSKLLSVKLEDIDVHTELNEYGFDSISLTEFTNKLNRDYNLELMPTIFFEHPTIHSVAAYLIEEHHTAFSAKFSIKTKKVIPSVPLMEETGVESPVDRKRHSRFFRTVAPPTAKPGIYPEPIAIIGMSGVFPMARDVHEFWQNLAAGRDCITEIPQDRWDWREYYGDPAREANKTNIKWGGFIDGIDEFDPLFFGISPREAQYMDPQQRLMMIHIWKSIEDAGYSAQSLAGTKTAIFVGTAGSGYSGLISQANVAIEGYSSTGIVPSVGPNRMSYFLNIHGPSEPIETACSSSLIAIHRAVTAMECGNCEMAIAGGVNTIVTPEAHISFSKAGMLSREGRCKTFSNQADGYVRGEGVGMIFLKKLHAAEQAGDHIYGVIRGTAENHGGRANSLTAPNPKAQAELLQTAYTKAGIDPRTVSFIEAHGTGTELGDPVEINGLKAAFQELYKATGNSQVVSGHCGLGSVKSNIGHLELAAGIAGVIKVLLQLKHKTLVKSLHCDTINPYIQLQDSPFYIVQANGEWTPIKDVQGKELPRRAGVSSFGFGGSNAHVVIEEYIPENLERPQIGVTPENPAIIVMSAKNEERLKEQAGQLLTAIQERQLTDSCLADIAYTLQVGREAMEERLALIAGSIRELEEKLRGFVNGGDGMDDLYRGQVKRNKETLAIFAADEELLEAVDKWIQRKKYDKLLSLWVKGLIIDWDRLYGEIRPCRISLPTYPFARESYWVPQNKPETIDIKEPTSIPSVPIQPMKNLSSLTKQQLLKVQHPLQFIPTAESTYSPQLDKPRKIALHLSSTEHALASKSKDETQESDVLALAGVALPQPQFSGESELVQLKLNIETSVTKASSDDSLQWRVSPKRTAINEYYSAEDWFRQSRMSQKEHLAAKVESTPTEAEYGVPLPLVEVGVSRLDEPGSFGREAIPVELLHEELRRSLATVLNMKPGDIDVDEQFFNLGVDSVTGMEWVQAVNEQYETSIKVIKVYDYPSINEFAGLLGKELSKQDNQAKNNLDLMITDSKQPLPKNMPQFIELPSTGEKIVPKVSTFEPIEHQIELQPLPAFIPVELLQEELAKSLADILSLKPGDIDVDDNFVNIGVDSVTGVKWIQKINEQYGILIKATKVYDYPSIRKIAEFLNSELSKQGGNFAPTPYLSIDDILQQAQSGVIDVEQADRLLRQFELGDDNHEL